MARRKSRIIRYDNCGRVLNKGESQRAADGRYMFQWVDRTTHKRLTIYADTLQELRKIEDNLQHDVRNGINLASGDSTLNQYYDGLMADRKDLKESTLSVYTRTYDRYIRDSFGKTKLSAVNSVMLERFYNHLIDEGLAEKTLLSVHTQISLVLKQAARHDIIRRDFSEGICSEVCKRRGIQSEARKAIEESSLKTFFEFAERNEDFRHYIPIIQVLLLTGLRVGEALAITRKDIDFDNNTIHVTKELQYIPRYNDIKGHLSIMPPKSEAGVRFVPMSEDTKTALKMALLYRTSRGGCKSVIDGVSDFVFVGRTGTVLWQANINKVIKQWVNAYNDEERQAAEKENRPAAFIPMFSCHSLRHTFTARVCEAGINPKLIQQMLGHKDYAVTMNVYASIRDEKTQETYKDKVLDDVLRFA